MTRSIFYSRNESNEILALNTVDEKRDRSRLILKIGGKAPGPANAELSSAYTQTIPLTFVNSELSDVGYTMVLVAKIGEQYPSYSRV